MNAFVQRHASNVIGILSGFDRLLFRGTLRRLANVSGLLSYMSAASVLLKDFKDHSMDLTEQIKQASVGVAEAAARPVQYLTDASIRKEEVAKSIVKRDKIENGLICVLSAVEPCFSYEIHRNAATRLLELRSIRRRCLHLYHYMIHPQLGFCHVRVQTWLPFNMYVCVNGREILARQMDLAGMGYRRKENCFVNLSDVAGAQALMDQQLTTNWGSLLDSVAALANPAQGKLFGPRSRCPIDPYWSVQQSEWATDVMFKKPRMLAGLYPQLIRHGMESLGSPDVLRFLGKHVPEGRNAHGNFTGEVITDLKDRPEGIRIKHAVNANSIKMYDKQASVCRVETTINDPADFKVLRLAGDNAEPDAKPKWLPMRKGVADLHRRAEVSQKANERYLEAMAAVEQSTPLKDLAELCKPVTMKQPAGKRSAGKGQRVRALNPMSIEDANLMQAAARGEFTINGFRNRDIRELLCGKDPADKTQTRRRSAAVGRKLRLLRAHGLIRKVPKTHRYQVSDKGRNVITALLTARAATTAALSNAA
jgi:hypothetical protein